MGETLAFAVVVERVGRTSYTLVPHAMKHAAEVVRCRLVSVATRLGTPGSIPLPADVAAALHRYRSRCGA